MDQFSTWKEIEGIDLAILPVGSLEQHGHHLPLGTDGIIANAIAKRLSDRFHPSYLLPLLPYSASFEHAEFPGSVSLRVPTIYYVIQDIVHSLKKSGIHQCIIINGHGGNHLLHNIVQELNANGSKTMIAPNRKHWEKAYEAAGLSTTPSQDMHAGEGETSILMHLFPEGMVREELIEDVNSPVRPLLEVVGIKPYTPTGAIGFPSRASAEKGATLLSELVNQISITVKEFLKSGEE